MAFSRIDFVLSTEKYESTGMLMFADEDERCRGGRNWAQVVVLCNFLEDIVQVRQ